MDIHEHRWVIAEVDCGVDSATQLFVEIFEPAVLARDTPAAGFEAASARGFAAAVVQVGLNFSTRLTFNQEVSTDHNTL